MNTIHTIIILMLTLSCSRASPPSCSSNINCLSTPNSHCQDGFCVCNTGYSFNCTSASTVLPAGSATLSIAANSVNYYVLDGVVGSETSYEMTFSDPNQASMVSTNQLAVYIDKGIGEAPESQGGKLWNYGTQLYVQFSATLQNIQGTNIPQNLVFNITYTGSTSTLLTIEYTLSTSSSSSSNILLIISYVCGGLLVLITLVFIVLIYRKRRNEDEEQRAEQTGERRPDKHDTAHFDIYMPAVPLSQRDRNEGKTCSVCLAEFQVTSRVRTTPCGHFFHKDCIDQWCTKNLSCPNCRTDLSCSNLNELWTQKAKQDDSGWIVNSIALEEDQSQPDNPGTRRQMEEPLYHTVDNNDL